MGGMTKLMFNFVLRGSSSRDTSHMYLPWVRVKEAWGNGLFSQGSGA